jgi:hypothetical protein
MKTFITLILAVSLFASCSNSYTSEIKTIDSLLISLDSSRNLLYAMDTGLVYKRIQTCTDNINYIFNHNESVNREQAFIIDDYSLCRKYYSKFAQKFPRLFDDIETVPRQLENLRKDLSKDLIPKEKASKFLIEEQLAAESMIESINQMAQRFESLDRSFIDSHEKILHLIQTIDSSEVVIPES